MKRRAFLSLMLGAAGAPLVPWRGLIAPVIMLAGREMPHVCSDSFWCNHPSHFRAPTAEEICADIERTLQQLLKNSEPIPYTHEGLRLIQDEIHRAHPQLALQGAW